MNIADEIAAASRARIGCSVCRFIEERDDADEWDAAMLMPLTTHTHRATWAAMVKRGFTAQSDNAISKHRKEGHRA